VITKIIEVLHKDILVLRKIFEIFIDHSKETGPSAHLENLIQDERTYVYAAMENDQVIGFALAYRFPSIFSSGDLAYLYDIEILPDQRRKGVGSMLLDFLLDHLKSRGVSEVWLGTATDNIAAQALFSRKGGIISGETFKEYIFQL
jgi:ribosomal protein S18 acetylase RimI-like enzyme